jgi:hypothetical protein
LKVGLLAVGVLRGERMGMESKTKTPRHGGPQEAIYGLEMLGIADKKLIAGRCPKTAKVIRVTGLRSPAALVELFEVGVLIGEGM